MSPLIALFLTLQFSPLANADIAQIQPQLPLAECGQQTLEKIRILFQTGPSQEPYGREPEARALQSAGETCIIEKNRKGLYLEHHALTDVEFYTREKLDTMNFVELPMKQPKNPIWAATYSRSNHILANGNILDVYRSKYNYELGHIKVALIKGLNVRAQYQREAQFGGKPHPVLIRYLTPRSVQSLAQVDTDYDTGLHQSVVVSKDRRTFYVMSFQHETSTTIIRRFDMNGKLLAAANLSRFSVTMGQLPILGECFRSPPSAEFNAAMWKPWNLYLDESSEQPILHAAEPGLEKVFFRKSDLNKHGRIPVCEIYGLYLALSPGLKIVGARAERAEPHWRE